MSIHRVGTIAGVIPCAVVLTALALQHATLADEPRLPTYPDHRKVLVVRNEAGVETPVTTPADWQVRRDHILAHLQQVMGPLPGGERRVPLNLEIVETVHEDGYDRQRVRYSSEPGDRVPAWLLIPRSEKPVGRRPAVLCLHQTTSIGKDEPAGLGGLENLHYAQELAKRGYVVLAPDYPGFGEHKIDVYKLGYASASMKAIWDNMRGVDLLTARDDVDGTRIGVIGHSLGGHNSIFTATFDVRLKAVVSSCGFNSFRDYYKGNITGWSHKGYMPRLAQIYHLNLDEVPFDFPELISALAPRPFLTNSPANDSNFDVTGVKVCIAAAEPVYRLLGVATDGADSHLVALYPDATHDFPKPERMRAYDFFDRFLGPVP